MNTLRLVSVTVALTLTCSVVHGQQGRNALEMAYAESDFVPGDEIIFEDDQANEKMGEFPSMWDLMKGSAEIASVGGIKCINLTERSSSIAPLMKDMNNYLPDVFTIEFDFYVTAETPLSKRYESAQIYQLQLYDGRREIATVEFGGYNMNWLYYAPGDNSRKNGNADVSYNVNSWNRLSVSFNQRAFKVYINGVRMANIPSMVAPKSYQISNRRSNDRTKERTEFISNVRVAKGAVPLYDRMLTEGKFITYGITFDVGKSTIKPESMGEINRIVDLMKQNPDLKFSVEGHTDNTGSAAANQTLSEARSQAVVDKLVENGISRDRLKSAGKGQTSPIADNATNEGRAKNRRVEFVKL